MYSGHNDFSSLAALEQIFKRSRAVVYTPLAVRAETRLPRQHCNSYSPFSGLRRARIKVVQEI